MVFFNQRPWRPWSHGGLKVGGLCRLTGRKPPSLWRSCIMIIYLFTNVSLYMYFYPQHMLRGSFSSGRDRVRRHDWICSTTLRKPLLNLSGGPFPLLTLKRDPLSKKRFLLHNGYIIYIYIYICIYIYI